MDSRQMVAIVEAIFFKGCSLCQARTTHAPRSVQAKRVRCKNSKSVHKSWAFRGCFSTPSPKQYCRALGFHHNMPADHGRTIDHGIRAEQACESVRSVRFRPIRLRCAGAKQCGGEGASKEKKFRVWAVRVGSGAHVESGLRPVQ